MKQRKEVKCVPTGLVVDNVHTRARVTTDLQGNVVVVIEQRETEQDVTEECTVKLIQSRHSGGYYCNILHDGRSVVALGVDDASKANVKPGYRMIKAPGATVSFHILKILKIQHPYIEDTASDPS